MIEKPGFAVVDGNHHFGQVTATKALAIGIEGARRQGAFTVMIRNCNHVGRLGSYTEKAALQGIGALMTVNGPGAGGVAPFGGIDRRLGTNPISIAAPNGDSPLVLDMTTSITAEGKVRVALQKGEKLSEGLIIDHDGNPSTDPADLYGPPVGAILPLGGAMGFKGFLGLSVMIDVFAGMLSGSGVCRNDIAPGANGVWAYFVDVSQFLAPADYDALMAKYVDHIKGSRKAAGVKEILMPGEIEQRRRADRERNGVEVPPETWASDQRNSQSTSVSHSRTSETPKSTQQASGGRKPAESLNCQTHGLAEKHHGAYAPRSQLFVVGTTKTAPTGLPPGVELGAHPFHDLWMFAGNVLRLRRVGDDIEQHYLRFPARLALLLVLLSRRARVDTDVHELEPVFD